MVLGTRYSWEPRASGLPLECFGGMVRYLLRRTAGLSSSSTSRRDGWKASRPNAARLCAARKLPDLGGGGGVSRRRTSWGILGLRCPWIFLLSDLEKHVHDMYELSQKR